MLADRPLLGVGPDNYPSCGTATYAGLADADRASTANNMYLEMLAGGGAGGRRGVRLVVLGAARQLANALRARGARRTIRRRRGIAAATVAIALHGLVDSFLSFTATYILIAVTLGLPSASRRVTGTHAHRL